MAVQLATSLLSLLLITVLFAGCESTSEKCQSVDFDTLLANKPEEQNLRLGSDGVYIATPSGCYVTTANSTSFESQHGDLFRTITAMMESSPDAALAHPRESRRSLQATAGCGQICASGDNCLYPCCCRFDYESCSQNFCFDIYRCQSC